MGILNLLASESTSVTTSANAAATSSCMGLGSNWTMWILLGIMVVLLGGMWFMNSRRAKKQQQEREDRMNSLSVGDKIVTIGMWIGEIVAKNNDGTYVLKTGDSDHVSFITIQEAAIYQIIKKEQASSDGVFSEAYPSSQPESDPSESSFEEEKKDE